MFDGLPIHGLLLIYRVSSLPLMPMAERVGIFYRQDPVSVA